MKIKHFSLAIIGLSALLGSCTTSQPQTDVYHDSRNEAINEAKIRNLFRQAQQDIDREPQLDAESYNIWKAFPNYTGAWQNGGVFKAGFIASDLSAQSLEQLQATVKEQYPDKNVEIVLQEGAVSYGDALALQKLFFHTEIAKLSDLKGIDYQFLTGRLTFETSSEATRAFVSKVMALLGFKSNQYRFEQPQFDDFFTPDISSLSLEQQSTNTTASAPVRAGTLFNSGAGKCTVGGFGKDSQGNVVVITAKHCFKPPYSSASYTNRSIVYEGTSTVFGKRFRVGSKTDTGYITLAGGVSYQKTYAKGATRPYGGTGGATLVDTTIPTSWAIVDSPTQVTGTHYIYGGNTGFNTVHPDLPPTLREEMQEGAFGETFAVRRICIVSKAVSTYKGDSGSAITNSRNQIVGIMTNVSVESSSSGHRNYCFTPTGFVKDDIGNEVTFF